jgi:NACHT domain-containing protein
MSSEVIWNQTRQEDGVRRRIGDKPSREAAAETLIVFVHGISGDCQDTWGSLPRLIHDTLECDANYFSFHYNSRWWQRASIGKAAKHLRQLLIEREKMREHLVFVTHSTGGLIVKRVLDLDRQMGVISPVLRGTSGLVASLFNRTRAVLNVAVPHRGGRWYLSWPSALVNVPLAVPLLLGQLTVGLKGSTIGVNSIIWQLAFLNPWLLRLDWRFRQAVEMSRELGLPRPLVHSISALDDDIVPEPKEPNLIYIPFAHVLSKLPESASDLVVEVFKNRLRPFSEWHTRVSLAVAAATLDRTIAFDKTAGVADLVRFDQQQHFEDSTVPYAIGSNQGGVHARIVQWLSSGRTSAPDTSVRVVTGVAQAGKSTVLRRVARDLASGYLGDLRSPQPILINLGRMTVASGVDSEGQPSENQLWSQLTESWLKEAKTSLPAHLQPLAPDREWFDRQLGERETVLLLDGLDEFLSRHPYLRFETVRQMIMARVPSNDDPSNVRIIVGVRSTQPGIRELAPTSDSILEVRRLSMEEAEQTFPGSAPILRRITDPELNRFVRTPMLLSQLLSADETSPRRVLDTRSGLFEAILRPILKHSVQCTADLPAQAHNTERLVDALMLVCWVMFVNYKGEATKHEIRAMLEAFAADLSSNPPEVLESVAAKNMVTAVHLLRDPSTLSTLLARTVLYSADGDNYRLVHPTWQDYFVGRFVARCLSSKYFRPYGQRGFTHLVSLMASEQSVDVVVTRQRVESVFAEMDNPNGDLIVGDFGSLMTSLKSPIEPEAFAELIARFSQVRLDVARHLLSAGLAYRVLRQFKDDRGAAFLATHLPPYLEQVMNDAVRDGDWLLASNAWFVLKAMASKRGLKCDPTTMIAWSSIVDKPDLEENASRLVCGPHDDPDLLHGLIQVGLFSAAKEIPSDPDLMNCLNYLFALACARKTRWIRDELIGELRGLFVEDSPMQRTVDKYAAAYVPEAKVLYDMSRRAFHAPRAPRRSRDEI